MNSQVRRYRIVSEPRRQSLDALLAFCAAHGAYGTLVDLFPSSAKGISARMDFLAIAEPYLEFGSVDRWPLGEPENGSVGHSLPLWKFPLTSSFVDILAAKARSLYDWKSPKLPEDLAIYRENGTVLLGTVSHECIGWLNLSSQEASSPQLGLVEIVEARR
jgi:hypothetical protein